LHRSAILLVAFLLALAVAIALIGGGWSWDSPSSG
jgi:hypothetical protein